MTRFFLCALGLMLIFEGLPYFAFPHRLKPWLAKMSELDTATLRMLGIAGMSIGMLLVYLFRPI